MAGGFAPATGTRSRQKNVPVPRSPIRGRSGRFRGSRSTRDSPVRGFRPGRETGPEAPDVGGEAAARRGDRISAKASLRRARSRSAGGTRPCRRPCRPGRGGRPRPPRPRFRPCRRAACRRARGRPGGFAWHGGRRPGADAAPPCASARRAATPVSGKPSGAPPGERAVVRSAAHAAVFNRIGGDKPDRDAIGFAGSPNRRRNRARNRPGLRDGNGSPASGMVPPDSRAGRGVPVGKVDPFEAVAAGSLPALSREEIRERRREPRRAELARFLALLGNLQDRDGESSVPAFLRPGPGSPRTAGSKRDSARRREGPTGYRRPGFRSRRHGPVLLPPSASSARRVVQTGSVGRECLSLPGRSNPCMKKAAPFRGGSPVTPSRPAATRLGACDFPASGPIGTAAIRAPLSRAGEPGQAGESGAEKCSPLGLDRDAVGCQCPMVMDAVMDIDETGSRWPDRRTAGSRLGMAREPDVPVETSRKLRRRIRPVPASGPERRRLFRGIVGR